MGASWRDQELVVSDFLHWLGVVPLQRRKARVKALARQPAERWATAGALADAARRGRQVRVVLPARPDGIRLPKADDPEVVERLDTILTEGAERGSFRTRRCSAANSAAGVTRSTLV